MNKNIVSIVIVAAVALLGLMAWGYSGSGTPVRGEVNAANALAVSERLYDFGTISMRDGDVTHIFEVENPTDKDVTLNDVSTSCMCTTAFIVDGNSKIGPFGMPGMGGITSADYVIKAHSIARIEAVYDPNAHGPAGVGNIDRVITLGQAGGGALQLEIKALVTP